MLKNQRLMHNKNGKKMLDFKRRSLNIKRSWVRERSPDLKKSWVTKLTEKFVEVESARDFWEEKFKKAGRESFNNVLRQVEYLNPKVDIKKSLCDPLCEIVDGECDTLYLDIHIYLIKYIKMQNYIKWFYSINIKEFTWVKGSRSC